MPTAIRTALASSKAATNDELAAEADTVLEQFQILRESSAVPHAVATVAAVPEIDAVHRPAQFPRSRQPLPPRRTSKPLCFLHRKFGVFAHSCKAPGSCPMRDQVSPAQGNGRAGH